MQRRFGLPKYLVLVRDLRASLASNYVKWRQRYAVDFSTYVRGDVRGRAYNSDLWWTLRFLNAWGDAAARAPHNVMVLRYEDLQAATATELFAQPVDFSEPATDVGDAARPATGGAAGS